jgi:putative salt-induced outer membrane protein YdiY
MTAALFLLPALASAPLAQDAAAEPSKVEWTGSFTLGATLTSGNSESTGINSSFDAERRAEHDRWTGKAFWNYVSTTDQTTDDSFISTRKGGASLKYDYFATKEIYYNAIAGADSDTVADLTLRSYIGAGVGFQWREEEAFKWGSEVGLTHFAEDRKLSDDSDYIAARLANNLFWQINAQTSFEQTAEAFPSIEDVEDFYGKLDNKAKVKLSDSMYAQLQYVLDYDNTPSNNRDRDDHTLTLGVGWSF